VEKLQAVLLGGAAGSFVSPQELDAPLTFEGVARDWRQASFGCGDALDDSVDLKDILGASQNSSATNHVASAFRAELARIRQEEILHRLAAGTPNGSVQNEIALLKEAAQAMRDGSICGLGQTAPAAILSAIGTLEPFSMSEPLNAPVSTIPVPRGPLPTAPAAEPVRMVEIKIDGPPAFCQ